MRKKKILFTGIVIIIFSLFVHVKFSDRSMETEVTITNIEALAEQETTEGALLINCIESGYICTGIDKNGNKGPHPGLTHRSN